MAPTGCRSQEETLAEWAAERAAFYRREVQDERLGAFKGIPPAPNVRGFWMMEHEVTQGEWEAVMGGNPVATGTRYWENEARGPCADVGVGPALPVACVSWEDATEFAKRVGARLPTEEEWEWAAKGGEEYEYAGSSDVDAVAWYDGNSGDKLHAGCLRQRNGYGLCDMSGNVREWTSTADGTDWVDRGGGWDASPECVRVADGCVYLPAVRNTTLGFRLVRSAP